jgi:hypothetical protein
MPEKLTILPVSSTTYLGSLGGITSYMIFSIFCLAGQGAKVIYFSMSWGWLVEQSTNDTKIEGVNPA